MKVAVLGAGLAGLSCAWKLSEAHEVNVFEKRKDVGGLSSSFVYKKHILDYGPHRIFTLLDHVENEIKSLMGDELLENSKRSGFYIKNHKLKHPLSIKELITKFNASLTIKIAASFLFYKTVSFHKKDITYRDYVINRVGNVLYNIVYKPFAKKLWGDPRTLSYRLAEIRTPTPTISNILKILLKGSDTDINVDTFYYPKHGMIMLPKKMKDVIEKNNSKVYLNSEIKKINIEKNRVKEIVYANNKRNKPDFIVSTIPVKTLAHLMGAPKHIKSAANKLKYNPLLLVYIVTEKTPFSEHFIFFPETDIIFNRLSIQKNFSPYTSPKDETVVTAEITDLDTINLSDNKIIDKVINDLEKTNILKSKNVKDYFILRLNDVYPIYDVDYEKNLHTVLEYLDTIKNLITTGRQGLFNYVDMDHSIDMGITASNFILNKKSNWSDIAKKFNHYKIVD